VNANFPAELATHLAESVRAARRRYRKRLTCCQEKFSEDAVHELRIETRRILALLDLLEGLHFPESLKKLRKTFKKRLDAFDDLRDTHVQLALLKPLWKQFPEAAELKKHLRKCEECLEPKLSKEIRSTKNGRLNRRLKEIEKCLCDWAAGKAAGRTGPAQGLLIAAFRRVFALRRRIRRNKPETIHRTRVAFKRFRYTAELLQPLLPQYTGQLLARMKDFQGAAGDIQDVAVLIARLDKDIADGDLDAKCVRGLRAELSRHERRAIDSFMKRIHELKDFEPEQSTTFAPEPEKIFA
jgi:CHAD domain-containing protein